MPPPERGLVVVGVSHRTAPVALREALAMGSQEAREALASSRHEGSLREAMVLSTCNRTEVYVVAPDGGADAALALLRRRAGELDLEAHRYAREGREAARHLCRVAAGLESMVLGEAQILGQVKAAGELARDADALGPVLDRLFGAAIHAGKRARAETQIGMGAISVASAAAALASKVLGTLRGRRVLVVGAGEAGALAARHFAKEGPGAITIANRTLERAAALASEVGGEALPLGRLEEALGAADVVVSATSAPGFIVSAEAVRRAMHSRPERPLVLLDVAVPRDVEPAAGAGENVLLHTVDALRTIVARSLVRRLREVPRVEAIVEEEVERFLTCVRGLEAGPLVRELREHFERVRAEEVQRSLKHFAAQEHEHLDRLTRSLVNKLLHLPTVRLKALDTWTDGGIARLHAVRELFALGDADLAPAGGSEGPLGARATEAASGAAGTEADRG